MSETKKDLPLPNAWPAPREPVAWMARHTTEMGDELTALGFTLDEVRGVIPRGDHIPLYATPAREIADLRMIVRLLQAIRIVPGKNGVGWAYAFGSEYPIEGPGDGTNFDRPQAALDAARAKVPNAGT